MYCGDLRVQLPYAFLHFCQICRAWTRHRGGTHDASIGNKGFGRQRESPHARLSACLPTCLHASLFSLSGEEEERERARGKCKGRRIIVTRSCLACALPVLACLIRSFPSTIKKERGKAKMVGGGRECGIALLLPACSALPSHGCLPLTSSFSLSCLSRVKMRKKWKIKEGGGDVLWRASKGERKGK